MQVSATALAQQFNWLYVLLLSENQLSTGCRVQNVTSKIIKKYNISTQFSVSDFIFSLGWVYSLAVSKPHFGFSTLPSKIPRTAFKVTISSYKWKMLNLRWIFGYYCLTLGEPCRAWRTYSISFICILLVGVVRACTMRFIDKLHNNKVQRLGGTHFWFAAVLRSFSKPENNIYAFSGWVALFCRTHTTYTNITNTCLHSKQLKRNVLLLL